MGRLASLLAPHSVAVVGANDDPSTYGGRVWRYLRRDFQGTPFAVNRRAGAVRLGQWAAHLGELPEVPELVLLATPSHTVPAILSEAGELGIRAAVVLARESLGHEPELRRIADSFGMYLLGPNCLGLINANARIPLSSSISLERPLRPGPLALVSQSGALMGVLHARATDLGLGLGVCVSTGSQAQIRVEDLLLEFSEMPEIQAVAACLEDLDVSLFEAAAGELRARGTRLIVLKGGMTQAGSKATAAHSSALAGNGRAFRQFAAELGAVLVDDPEELLMALAVGQVTGRCLHVASVSGGLSAVAADEAINLGLTLPEPSPAVTHALQSLGMPPLTNPLDLEALPSTPQEKADAIAALAGDEVVDRVLVVLNDMPGLGDLLEALAPVAARAGDRLLICSVCSEQSDHLWRTWTEQGHTYVDGLLPTLRALAWVLPLGPRNVHPEAAHPEHIDADEVIAALASAGIPVIRSATVSTSEEAVRSAETLGYPVVVKLAQVSHRGVAGVRLGLQNASAVRSAARDLVPQGRLIIQPQARPGLEFYVGVLPDPTFGQLLLIGMGGTIVEEAADVAVVRSPVDEAGIRRALHSTLGGRWLESPASRQVADLDALVEIAKRAADLAAGYGDQFRTLDLNPVVVHPSGATVVDAKISLIAAQSPGQPTHLETPA